MNIRLGRLATGAIVLYLLVSTAFLGYRSLYQLTHYPRTDFSVFYGGAKAVVSKDRQTMYVATLAEWTNLGVEPPAALNGFFYPPVVAYALLPLTLFDLPTAQLIYAAISVAAGLGLLWVIYQLTNRDRVYLVLALAALLSCWATYLTLGIGQSGLLFAFLCGLALLRIEGDKEGSAGWFVALLVIKPMFFVGPICLLAWKRRWQSLGLAVCLAAVLILVPFLRLGFDTFQDYRHATSMLTSAGFTYEGLNAAIGAHYMLSWNGYVASLTSAAPSYWVVLPLDALTVLLALKALAGGTLREAWLALTAAAVLVSPHILAYDWLVLLPAVIAALHEKPTGLLIGLALLVHLGLNLSIYELRFVWNHPPPSLPGGYWGVPPLVLMLVYMAFRQSVDDRIALLRSKSTGSSGSPVRLQSTTP